jgi:hypothetical protein
MLKRRVFAKGEKYQYTIGHQTSQNHVISLSTKIRTVLMKNTLTIAIMSVLFSFACFAQPRFGLTAGLNLSSWGGKDASFGGSYSLDGTTMTLSGPNTRTGFAVGMFLDAKVNEYLSIHPEVLYSMKGAKYDLSGAVNVGTTYSPRYVLVSGDMTAKYDYLDIPLLLKFNIQTQSNIQPVLLVGPSIGILVNSKIQVTASALGNSASSEIAVQNQNSVDLGLLIGGGFTYPVNTYNLDFTVRYGIGLSSVDNTPGAAADITNHYFGIQAAIEF